MPRAADCLLRTARLRVRPYSEARPAALFKPGAPPGPEGGGRGKEGRRGGGSVTGGRGRSLGGGGVPGWEGPVVQVIAGARFQEGIPEYATYLGGMVLVGSHLGSAPPGRGGDCRTLGDGTGDLRSPSTLLGEESGTLGAAALPPVCSILRSPEVSGDRGAAATARTAFPLARPPPRCRRWSGGSAVLRQPEAKAPPQPEACTSPCARPAPAPALGAPL